MVETGCGAEGLGGLTAVLVVGLLALLVVPEMVAITGLGGRAGR